jgi:hypothetical protein
LSLCFSFLLYFVLKPLPSPCRGGSGLEALHGDAILHLAISVGPPNGPTEKMMEAATTGSGYLAVALFIKHHCLVT